MIVLKILLLDQIWVYLLVQFLNGFIVQLYKIFQVFLALSFSIFDGILSVFLTPVGPLSMSVNFLHLLLTFLLSLLVSQLIGVINLKSVHFCIVFHIRFVLRVDLCNLSPSFFVLGNSLVKFILLLFYSFRHLVKLINQFNFIVNGSVK